MTFSHPPGLRPRPPERLLPSLTVIAALTAPVLLPLGVLLVQALAWELIAPYAWLGFLPAVAASAWLAGLRGGLLAVALSVGASEWLLSFGDPHLPQEPEPRIFSALAFSGLSLAVVLFLDRTRREWLRLRVAIRRLGAALLGEVPLASGARAGAYGLAVVEELALIEAVHAELFWRKAALTELRLPIAAFALDGTCLYANPAFTTALALDPASMARRNLLVSGDFPSALLTQALQRLIAIPGPGRSERAVLGRAGEAQLQWLAAEGGAVVLCTIWGGASPFDASPRPGAAASGQPAAASGAATRAEPAWPPPHAVTPPVSVPPPVAATPSPAAASLDGLRCLVVDDQAINRELMREILGFEGVAVSLCASGREAVERVRAEPQAFDVVLMDLQMPGMDGYAAARALRALPGAEQLPILAVTADGPGIPPERLRQSGMLGVLHKPLDVERLTALLSSVRSV